MPLSSGRTEAYGLHGRRIRASLEPNGRELFYRNGSKIMAVDIETEGTLAIAQTRLLFDSESHLSVAFGETGYDVSADGQRFVMIDQSESAKPPTELVFVENWAEELKRLVPTND